jgi:GntR family transcriptional regulator
MSLVKARSVTPRPGEAGSGDRVIKYIAIRDWIGARIASGEWPSGKQLPSEHEIMAMFGVSRVTTRQALDLLRAEGRIDARRGKGYFVARMLATAELERLQSFGEMMAPLGLPTRSEVIEISEVLPDKTVAQAFALEATQTVIRIVRARIAAGVAVSLDESFLPLALGRRLILLDLARYDIFLLMETRLDIAIGHADITLGVAPVPPELAGPLGLATGGHAIRLQRITRDTRGRALMFEHIHARQDLLQFRIHAPR